LLAVVLSSGVFSFAQEVSLSKLVTPSTVVFEDGHPVTFAIHAFIEFESLNDAFPYIESQTERWKNSGKLDAAARQRLGRQLLHEAIESRVISTTDERLLELLITHTAEELKNAIAMVKETLPSGYQEAFLDVQEKWKHPSTAGVHRRRFKGGCCQTGIPSRKGSRSTGRLMIPRNISGGQ